MWWKIILGVVCALVVIIGVGGPYWLGRRFGG